ncbi:MAG: hypothetical protein Q8914_09380 [Bacteroidota bacterium]|nr:hypothetical protein [Bacteroidota bacterium]
MKNKTNFFKHGSIACLLISLVSVFTFYSCDNGDDAPAVVPTSKLYIAGSAATGITNVTLEKDSTIFTYSGVLSAGTLYFQTTKGSDKNVYKLGQDSTVELNGTTPFTIPEKGYYDIVVNLTTKKITMSHSALGNSLFMIGPPVDAWDGVRGGCLTCTDAKPFVYTYTHFFFAGAYKFLLQTDNMLAKFAPDKTSGDIVFFPTEDAAVAANYQNENWNLASEGDYTVTVDLLQKKVTMTPVVYFPNLVDSVFIVGNKYGWDANVGGKALTRSTANSKVFSITDNLDAGVFKFALQKHCYRPCLTKVTDTQFAYYTAPSDAQDVKWEITAAGNYTITLNLSTNGITIVKN